MQPGLLCNLPTSLGKEAAEGKGHSYWASGGGEDLRCDREAG